MKKNALFLMLFTLLSSPSLLHGQVIQFQNGNVFDSTGFQKKDFWVVNDKITFIAQTPDTVIDINDKFVIPPFGEAHNHNIDQSWELNKRINSYLSKGVFYYKNPNSIPALTNTISHQINHQSSLDVSFANGGLTGTDGHPIVLYEEIWNQGLSYLFPGKSKEVLEGEAYYIINDENDLNSKWETILGKSPDFIKIYVLYSEDYEKRKDSEQYRGKKGLNPKVVPSIVKKAHESGLRVSAHIETAHDYRVALESEVDEINHLPAYMNIEQGFSYLIDEDLAKKTRENNVTVVATYSLLENGYEKVDSIKKEEIRQVQIKNLKNLTAAGVNIAIGCDDYLGTSHKELFYLHGLNIFTNLELIKMYTKNSAYTIFPERKIGEIAEGYEADFLILNDNPIKDIRNVEKIHSMYKDGRILKID